VKITIIASGSRGDVQPYVALGKGLKDAGHAVRVLTSQDFENLVIGNELDFFDMGGNMQAVAQQMQGLLEQGNFLKILASMGKTANSMIEQASKSGLTACRDMDLIISGIGGLFTGLALSEKLSIPFLPAFYYPFSPTKVFPNALVPLPPIRLPGWINKLTHSIAQQMMWQNFRSADNKARRQVLEMAQASFWGPFKTLQRKEQTILYGYSPQVIPKPSDWGDRIHVTGYWFLEPEADWQPPIDLVQFLQSGPAPVYIGFGSMGNSKPEETTDLILKALASTGQRGVLSAGWGGFKKEDMPENVFMIDSLPFSWLFPQMAAVVHHGGAGTTSIGLWSGVPSIVTPFMGDQPFWGQRVYELGVGPRPIRLRRLTSEKLAEAIHQAVTDNEMRKKAAALGELIRKEDGIGNAVAVIEQYRSN
jgi:UDP:flavonoid glycosyltransferase YjiC (YdhE family)